MRNNTYIRASYSLYDYGHGTDLPHPRDIPAPEGGEKIAWIPQTLFDSIWVVYSFSEKSHADKFMGTSGIYGKAVKKIANRQFRKRWGINQ